MVAAKSDDIVDIFISTFLLAMAIVSLHFIAAGAITFVPDPTVAAAALSISPTSLSLIIGASAESYARWRR